MVRIMILIMAVLINMAVLQGQRISIEKQTQVATGTDGVALVRESSTQVGPADGTSPRVTVEGTGVTDAGFRIRTNSTNRWDLRTPSGGTELEFANSTPTAVAEFSQAGNLTWLQDGTGPIDSGARVYDIRAYGAVCDGATDDLTAFEGARNAANTAGGGTIFVPGDCAISGNLNIATDNHIVIEGVGPEVSIIRQLTNGGVTTLGFNQSSSNTVGVEVRNITINNSAAATNTGIGLNIASAQFQNVKYVGGDVGLYVNSGAGESYFSKQLWVDQATTGLRINGDSSGELTFIDSFVTRDSAGTLTNGVLREKSNSTDLGGVYFVNFRITKGSGTITNCYNFQDDATPGPLFLVMVNSVADGCTVPINIEGDNFGVSNSWFIPLTNVGTDAVVIDGSTDGVLTGNTFVNCADGVSFLNSANNIELLGNNHDCTTNMYDMPASNFPTEIVYRDANPKGLAVSDNVSEWVNSADLAGWITGGFSVYTDDGSGNFSTLRIFDGSGSLAKHIRVDGSGNLEVVNNAFTAILAEILDAGGIKTTSLALAGLGTPANGTMTYCTDCLKGSDPCTGASTGAMAMRVNGAWQCM